MKSIIFDSGPIITLALNRLLWILPRMKKIYGGKFLIPHAVKHELIDRPLQTRKYKLEALQVLPLINDGTLEVVEETKTRAKTAELLSVMNHTYWARGHPITIVQDGEIDAISLMLITGSQVLVVDERNTRYLIETPNNLKKRLERKLHTVIKVDNERLQQIKDIVKPLHTMRTAELLMVGYKRGIFDDYLNKRAVDPHRELLDALLWGAKLNGCSVSEEEITEMVSIGLAK